MKDYINNIQTDMKNEHQYKIIDLKEPIYFFSEPHQTLIGKNQSFINAFNLSHA
jgi:hypothetical protein